MKNMYVQQETCIYSDICRFITTTSNWHLVYECWVDYLKLHI